MSVIGKGRGRGFTDIRDAPLRRPGQLNKSKFNDLINAIENLFIKDIISGNNINEIVQWFENFSKHNSLKDIFDDLHKQALEDRQFGIKLAIACSDPKIYALNDCNLRLILLQTLQKDYEDREQIKRRNDTHFRNAISLLGGVYCNLKLNGKPMDILATPLLHYLESLLDTAEEEDIELVTIQVFINGSKLVEQSSAGSENFLMLVRHVLVNRNLSAKSRAMLLYIIDSSNQHYKPLLGRLREFYFNEIDGNPFIEIENQINNITNGTRPANDGFDLQNFDKLKNKPDQCGIENKITTTTTKVWQEQVDLEFETTEKRIFNINSEKPSVPRAIRGAGAGDGIKDKNNKKLSRKKDKMTDDQIWSSKQNTSSRVWGHDDRFDKDYTQT